jgi:hypothetical protein
MQTFVSVHVISFSQKSQNLCIKIFLFLYVFLHLSSLQENFFNTHVACYRGFYMCVRLSAFLLNALHIFDSSFMSLKPPVHCVVTVDRHNLAFVYAPSKINKRIHATAIHFVIMSVALLQFLMVVFSFIRHTILAQT